MRNAATVAGLALFLGACSNLYSYTKPGADAAATQADIAACKSVMAPYGSSDEAKDVFDKCMAGKGYDKQVEKYHL